MQSYGVLFKIVFIGIVGMACFIASVLVFGLVNERQTRHDDVQTDIGRTWGVPQTVVGPMLVFTKPPRKDSTTPVEQYVLPSTLKIESTVIPEVRSRGMYDTVVYTQTLRVSGVFATADVPDAPTRSVPTLVLALSDTRSIETQVALDWNGASVLFEPGLGTQVIDSAGIHARVPFTAATERYPFSFEFTIKGSKEALFVPLGKETEVRVVSPWMTPEFTGAFLPSDRTLDAQGFRATWHVSSYGRNVPQAWDGVHVVGPSALTSTAFGVHFYDGVNLYTQIDRSVKYAILFIVITFTVFFLFDILQHVRVHPVQYLLIGAALALFYLLLLSFAEQIGFLKAYVLATGMITLLVTWYSASVLKEKARALVVGITLTILYTFLYFVLKLEDYALVFGSLLLFALLACVMFLTRRVDWFSVGKSDASA